MNTGVPTLTTSTRTSSEVEALALAMLRAVFTRPDLTPDSRDKFVADMVSGKEEMTVGFADLCEMARTALAGQVLDVDVEREAWRAWYYDPEGHGGKTFGYQDTQEGHHIAFAAMSEEAWLERAASRKAYAPLGPTLADNAAPAAQEPEKLRKYPDIAYALIDPAYELLDDGTTRHRTTGVIRPKLYSGLPIPFKVGDQVKVVEASWQFPLGTIGRITHIDQGITYFNGTPCCWERFDLHQEGGA